MLHVVVPIAIHLPMVVCIGTADDDDFLLGRVVKKHQDIEREGFVRSTGLLVLILIQGLALVLGRFLLARYL